jgi:hypothetical protein
MTRYFSVTNNGKTLLIRNSSGRNLTVLGVTVKYGVTVDTLEGKGIRNIGDDLRIDKEVASEGTLEVQLKLPNPSSVILIFKDGELFRREDISL